MKKLIAFGLILFLAAGLFAGCGAGTGERAGDGKLRIAVTIFPLYDWVKNVLGDEEDGAELTLLLDKGVDLHSFQPSAADVVKIASADLFVYVGGASDEWVTDALKESADPDARVISLMEVLGAGAREEEIREGMEEEEEEDGEEPEYDEHVWLSLRNAELFVGRIAEELGALDPERRDVYRENAAEYAAKLAALDGEYKAAADGADVKTLLFADRFPFRYLTEDYGLDYYAAFPGCSAESEASFRTVVFLAGKADELDLPAILTIETGDGKMARTVNENTEKKDRKILVMDSMQGVSLDDAKAGTTYLGVMEKNLETLREALYR